MDKNDTLMSLLKSRGVNNLEKRCSVINNLLRTKAASKKEEESSRGSVLLKKAYQLGQQHAKLYATMLNS